MKLHSYRSSCKIILIFWPSVNPSIHPSIRLSVCLSFYLSLFFDLFLYTCLFFTCFVVNIGNQWCPFSNEVTGTHFYEYKIYTHGLESCNLSCEHQYKVQKCFVMKFLAREVYVLVLRYYGHKKLNPRT